MSKDISRFLHQPNRHYAAARLGQGRILVDSDFNEGARLLESSQIAAVLDAIGPHGSPDTGFSIGQPLDPSAPDALPDALEEGDPVDLENIVVGGQTVPVLPVSVRAGSMYLGGKRLAAPRSEHIAFQRDYLQLRPEQITTTTPFSHWYYLHTWEQCVSSVEDDETGEPMLRGPDSSVRMRRMRRVERFDEFDATQMTLEEIEFALLSQLSHASYDRGSGEIQSMGRLQLTFAYGNSADPCAPCEPNIRRYLGAENTTLRIMLTQADRFVWGYDNGGPVFRVKVTGLPSGPLTVEMLTPPLGESQVPLANRVVELLPFGAVLTGGDLSETATHPHAKRLPTDVGATLFPPATNAVRDTLFTRALTSYDRDSRSFTVEADPNDVLAFVSAWDDGHPDAELLNSESSEPNTRYLYMRLWHSASVPDEIELPIQFGMEGEPLGDTGVVPIFQQPGRPGDFWVATLRTETPDVIVPFDLRTNPDGVPPHGPRHFIAPVALVAGTANEITQRADLRRRVRSITDDTCVTCVVGDGVHSFGDFRTIQEGVDALPTEGGRIAVRPGFYPGRVKIQNRRNISIEGCGDSTVLEIPRTQADARLFDISGSEGISISSMRLHQGRKPAVIARDESSDVTLSNLTIIGGTLKSGVFVPGGARTERAMIELFDVPAVTLSGISFQSYRRPVVVLSGAELATLTDLTVVGGNATDETKTYDQIEISDCTLVRMNRATMTSYGQVAVSVQGACRDVELRHVNVTPKRHNFEEVVHPSRVAIDVESGEQVLVEKCRVNMELGASEDAGVAVRGSRIIVRDCEVTAGTGGMVAWGGIHVRGGSEHVEIRNNRIQGGAGHGITLGGVLWRLASSPIGTDAHRREAVGRAQLIEGSTGEVRLSSDVGAGFTTSNGTYLLPEDEGPIFDLIIADNRIEGMGANGISAITVLGLQYQSTELVELQRCRIEGNVITKCLERMSSSLPQTEQLPFPGSIQGYGVSMPVLPFGGIVLSAATGGVDIRNNTIVDNAQGTGTLPETLPINGIFVLAGEGIDISGNRILNNGRPPTSTNTPFPGVRAGIAVMLAGTDPTASLHDVRNVIAGSVVPPVDGSSLRVRRNNVQQVEGRALHVVATGPMSIDGNYFSSMGYHGSETTTDRYRIGDVVFVQNMGAPWEVFGIQDVGLDQIPTGGIYSYSAPPPAGQEEGFVGYDNPEAPNLTARYLLDSIAQSPRFFIGDGGRTLFHNNQVVLDWDLKRISFTSPAAIAYFPTAILGLDHVSITGNSFGLRLQTGEFPTNSQIPYPDMAPSEPLLAQVFAYGGTLQVMRNRIASGVYDVHSSFIGFSELMGQALLNQTTHPADMLASYYVEFPNADESVPYVDLNTWLVNLPFSDDVADRQARDAVIRRYFGRLMRSSSRGSSYVAPPPTS